MIINSSKTKNVTIIMNYVNSMSTHRLVEIYRQRFTFCKSLICWKHKIFLLTFMKRKWKVVVVECDENKEKNCKLFIQLKCFVTVTSSHNNDAWDFISTVVFITSFVQTNYLTKLWASKSDKPTERRIS